MPPLRNSSAAEASADPEGRLIFAETKRYEQRLSRLLIAFISAGLVFLIGPGSFLGLMNLLAISHFETAGAVPLSWVQAHGHAEVYGWVGSFILGIGFHSLTRVRGAKVPLGWGWGCWGLWTAGVAMSWWAGIYAWHWRIWLPVAAGLELVAFLIFQVTISRTHRQRKDQPKGERRPGWILLVFTGAMGFLLTLVLNLGAAICIAFWEASPVFPASFDWQMVELLAWAFLVPFVLGFSTRWFPIFAGFRPAAPWMPPTAVALVAAGAAATLWGEYWVSALCWLGLALVAAAGLQVFRRAVQPARTQGIHPSFPVFLRFAYGWLMASALLGVWAAFSPTGLLGLAGASRHALTVGFVAGMVMTIGPRILPAFSGMKRLYSPGLMFLALLLLEIGCALRVSGELLAYPGWLPLAWNWLPYSAGLEVTAFVIFAYNMGRTLMQPPAHEQRLRSTAESLA